MPQGSVGGGFGVLSSRRAYPSDGSPLMRFESDVIPGGFYFLPFSSTWYNKINRRSWRLAWRTICSRTAELVRPLPFLSPPHYEGVLFYAKEPGKAGSIDLSDKGICLIPLFWGILLKVSGQKKGRKMNGNKSKNSKLDLGKIP